MAVAVAVSVPVPGRKTPKPGRRPDSSGAVKSKLSQSGHTTGGATVSTQGSTKGSFRIKATIKGPGKTVDQNSAANAGVSGSSVSAKEGVFAQRSGAKTEITNKKGRLSAETTSQGTGITGGGAGTMQNTGANGGANQRTTVTRSLPAGKKVLRVKAAEKASVSSSSGHKSSTTGSGSFKVINKGGTDIKLELPELDIEVASSQQQAGGTTRGGSVSAEGATRGSAVGSSGLDLGKIKGSKATAANAGASATSVSTGLGAFKHRTTGRTRVASSKDKVKVTSRTGGRGSTGGGAGIVEKSAARGRARHRKAIIVTLPDGKKRVRIVGSDRSSAKASSKHEASSSGLGDFKSATEVGTEIKLDPLKL
nr:CP19k-like protein 1 [Chthamalus malayensis]